MKRHKYGAKKVIVTEDGTMFEVELLKKYNITDITGIPFDSKAEAAFYLELKSLPEVEKIELQPKFILQEKPKITYIADFLVTWKSGKRKLFDVKGVMTPAFRIKKKLYASKYPDLPLLIFKKKGNKFIEVS